MHAARRNLTISRQFDLRTGKAGGMRLSSQGMWQFHSWLTSILKQTTLGKLCDRNILLGFSRELSSGTRFPKTQFCRLKIKTVELFTKYTLCYPQNNILNGFRVSWVWRNMPLVVKLDVSDKCRYNLNIYTYLLNVSSHFKCTILQSNY